MQAIHLTKYGKPEEGLRLVEIAEPGDPEPGQVLIRVEYAPINDSDLALMLSIGSFLHGTAQRSARCLHVKDDLGRAGRGGGILGVEEHERLAEA